MIKDGKNVGGRPKKEFDKDTFEKLCSIFCTKDEICDIFNCNEKTLTRWCEEIYGLGFYDIYKKYNATGKTSLRRMQYKAAENGNVTMLVWLGKQYLGQVDRQEVTLDSNDVIQPSLREQLKKAHNESGN